MKRRFQKKCVDVQNDCLSLTKLLNFNGKNEVEFVEVK